MQIQLKNQEIENLQSKLTISENKRKNIDIDFNNNDTPNKKPRTSDLLDQGSDVDVGSTLLDNQSKTQTQNLKISPELSPYNSPQQDNEEMFFPGPDASTQQILDFDPIKYLQSSNKNNNANKITTSKDDEEDLGYESAVHPIQKVQFYLVQHKLMNFLLRLHLTFHFLLILIVILLKLRKNTLLIYYKPNLMVTINII